MAGDAEPEGATRSVYPMESWRRVLTYLAVALPALFGLSVPFLAAAGVFTGSLATVVAASIFPLVLAALFVYLTQRTSLVISPDGAEYRVSAYRVRASWSDIERIGRGLEGTSAQADVLITRDGRKLPLSIFDSNWRRGQLGEELRRYAPHLFPEDIPFHQ